MPAETVPRERTISHLLRYFENLGSGDSFRRMCILDALILNSDRHIGNFGVLYDNDTMQVQRMAPVFDNNRSMLFDLDNDQLKKLEVCVRHYLNASEQLGVLSLIYIGLSSGLRQCEPITLSWADFHVRYTPHLPHKKEKDGESPSEASQAELKQAANILDNLLKF